MRTLTLLLMGSIAMFTTTCNIIDSQKFPEYTDHWTEYQLYMGKELEVKRWTTNGTIS